MEGFFGRRPLSVIRKSRTQARGVIQVGFVITILQLDFLFFFSFLNWIPVPNCGCKSLELAFYKELSNLLILCVEFCIN